MPCPPPTLNAGWRSPCSRRPSSSSCWTSRSSTSRSRRSRPTSASRRRTCNGSRARYALTFGGFLLLGGRAADLLGRRRLFMVGLAVFAAASLACGLAGPDERLIGFRALQGLGAARSSPRPPLHPDDHLHRGRRAQQGARHLGRRSPASAAPPACSLGGVLTDLAGLGVDLLHQRAGRDRRHGAGPAPARREPRRRRRTATSTCRARVTATGGLVLLVYGIVGTATTAGRARARSARSRPAALLVSSWSSSTAGAPRSLPLRLFRLPR